MRKLLKRPRHATVVAYLALFAALAGGAYAAATINSGDVVNNSLKTIDLKNNRGVKGIDVRNSSLRGNDIADDTVSGADVNESSLLVGRIVAKLGGATATPIGAAAQSAIPNGNYTQAADSLDQSFGDAKVTFSAACTQPRQAIVYLLRDYVAPLDISDVVGFAQFADTSAGAVTKSATLGPFPAPGAPGNYRLSNGAAQPATYSVYTQGACNAGSGITLDEVRVHILGAR
jgi:hypothetical protein